MKNKFYIIVVVTILCFSVLYITVTAEEQMGDITINLPPEYSLDKETGVLTIKASSIIPATNYSSKIHNATKEIVILDGPTEIADNAFCNFPILEKVTIPDSITSIGYGTFQNCPMLEKYENGVFYIDKYAIRFDPQAESITVKEGTVLVADGDQNGDITRNITSLSLPSSLLYIGNYSFAYAPELSQVSIGDELLSIGYRSFYETALSDCEDGVLYVDNYVVDIDFNITEVNVREGSVLVCNAPTTNRLGDRKWESITLPKSLKTIGDRAFTCSIYLTSMTIPEGVTHIGDGAFSSAESLCEISLPQTLTYIGSSAFRSCDSLLSVSIPDNVTYLGANAFRSCDALESVTFGNGIDTIPNRAFYYCKSLENITFPQNLTTIEAYAFEGCSSLTSISFPDTVTSVGGYAFQDCTGIKSVHVGAAMNTLFSTSFFGCNSIEYIYLDAQNTTYTLYENGLIKDGTLVLGSANTKLPQDGTLTSIGYGALAGKNIRSITLPVSLTSIKGSTFEGCTLLEEIIVAEGNPYYTVEGNCVIDNSRRVVAGCQGSVIPNDITEILSEAFYGCVGLKKITIPSSVTYIGEAAFEGCSSLTAVTFEEGDDLHLQVDQRGFYGSAITEVVFTRPTTLLDASFGYIDSLDRIIIKDEFDYISLSELMFGIKISPFPQSLNISYVSFPDEEMMFKNLDIFMHPESIAINEAVIEHLLIPADLENIPSFRHSNIKSLTIPDGITSIGRYTFSDCKYLENIYFNATSCTVEQGAFENCGILGTGCTVTIGAGVTEIPENFLSCLFFSSSSNVVKVILPEGVTKIGKGAFRFCSSLKEIKLPSSLVTIGSEAFLYAGIEEITVPDGVTSIGGSAFSHSAIRKIYIPDSVTDFGDSLFYFCLNLSECRLPSGLTEIPQYTFCACESLESIVIPSGVTYIGNAAFSGCVSITSLALPHSLIHIGDAVFSNCKALSTLHIPDTVTHIGGGAFSSSGIVVLVIPAGVFSIADDVFDNLMQTKTILILSPYVWEKMPLFSFGKRCSVKSVASGLGMTDYEAIGKYTVKDTATIAGIDYRVYSDHAHAWSYGKDVEGATTICYKEWTCSDCLIYDTRLHHTTNGEATCTEDQICTVCNTLLVARLGHSKTEYDGIAPTCLEPGYTPYFTCSRCDYSSYTYLSPLGHDEIIHNSKAPACESHGWNEYMTCSRCDYSTYEEISALGHDRRDFEGKSETCTEGGWLPYSACSRCGINDKIILEPAGHAIFEADGRAPTCYQGGWNAYSYCSRVDCGYSTYAYIDALGHDEIYHEAKAPTCTEFGWYEYVTCSRCDYSTYMDIFPLNHDEIYHEAKDPSCTEFGWYEYVTCSRCDYSTYLQNDALGHLCILYGAQTPTCTEVGHNDYEICMRCNYSTYEKIDALGHNEIYHEAKDPTCTVFGWREYVTCSRCGYTTYEEIAALGHSEIAHDAQNPTCESFGWNSYVTCSHCDHTTYEEIAALGHHEIWHDAVHPTCDDIGWNAYISCLRCDYTTYEEIRPLGHDYSIEWSIDIEPTCIEQGSKSHHCLRCEAKDNITDIPISNHTYGDWYETQTPTCTATGIDERECSVCHSRETRTTAAKGHTNADPVVENKVDATCTAYGSYDSVIYCSVCSAKVNINPIIIYALGHDYMTEWTEDVVPTCTRGGKKSHHCSRCDDRDDVTKIPALGHSFTDYKSNSDATYTADGTKTAKCDRCDNTNTITDKGSALGLDKKFKDELAALTNDANFETTYSELYSLLQTYATLSKEEKANVATEFATVQQMINEYNEKTRVANSELADATEIAFSPIVATGFTFLAGLWFLLKKKFFI